MHSFSHSGVDYNQLSALDFSPIWVHAIVTPLRQRPATLAPTVELQPPLPRPLGTTTANGDLQTGNDWCENCASE